MRFVFFFIFCIILLITFIYLKINIPIWRFIRKSNYIIIAYDAYQMFLYHEYKGVFEFQYGKYIFQITNKEDANTIF